MIILELLFHNGACYTYMHIVIALQESRIHVLLFSFDLSHTFCCFAYAHLNQNQIMNDIHVHLYIHKHLLRDRPFNLKGGGHGFYPGSEYFFALCANNFFSSPGHYELLSWVSICRPSVRQLFTFKSSSLKPLNRNQPNLPEMFTGWSSTRFVFLVLI